jgi:hypothetical protein
MESPFGEMFLTDTISNIFEYFGQYMSFFTREGGLPLLRKSNPIEFSRKCAEVITRYNRKDRHFPSVFEYVPDSLKKIFIGIQEAYKEEQKKKTTKLKDLSRRQKHLESL